MGAGFRRWRDFTAARRKGLFPRPDLELPDGPRWSETRLRAWLQADGQALSLEAEEARLIERLERAAHRQAPPLRRQARP